MLVYIPQRNSAKDFSIDCSFVKSGFKCWLLVDDLIILSLRVLAVRSLSYAGSAAKADVWMGNDEKPPLIGAGLSPLFMQEKRGIQKKYLYPELNIRIQVPLSNMNKM